MVEYETEAEHLSEIYDDCECGYFEPYSRAERADYIRAKNNRFAESCIGKFVVAQTPRKNKGVIKLLYLVDRNLTKRFWWSHDAIFAMVFDKREAAEIQARKYRYNKARVMEIKPYMANMKEFEQEYE